MSQKQYALYDDRFLEPIAVTHIMGDPKISIIELIANSWDAGATEVTILWPEEDEQKFSIKDDGHGMTKAHFLKRFRTLAYNRIREQGSIAEIPPDHQDKIGSRPTFGRNGKGRLGGFAFGDSYTVVTSRDGQESTFKVAKDLRHTLTFQEIGDQKPNANHGTKIFIESAVKPHLSVEEARKEIGMRFLTDPNFKVKLNGVEISFADIPEDHIHEMNMIIDGIGTIKVLMIDVQSTDKSTQKHGIAWHVKRRLVGECTWKGSGSEGLVDGRRSAAKRFIFIVEADCLEDAVSPDWTTFLNTNAKWKKAAPQVYGTIKSHLLDHSKAQREETFKEIEHYLNMGERSQLSWVFKF